MCEREMSDHLPSCFWKGLSACNPGDVIQPFYLLSAMACEVGN